MQDETLFLATLSFAAVHLDIAAKRYTGLRALSYKGQASQTVNERLRSSGTKISNSTIGAVAMLSVGICKS